MTNFTNDSINVAIVKEFYANLYDPEDKSLKQVRVRGHLIKFDEDTLNTFLKPPVILEEGENLYAYSRFALLRPDPQELAAKLYILGRGFELNADGQPLKILRKNMTTHYKKNDLYLRTKTVTINKKSVGKCMIDFVLQTFLLQL